MLSVSATVTVTIKLSMCIAVAPEGTSCKSGLGCKNRSGSGKMRSAGGTGEDARDSCLLFLVDQTSRPQLVQLAWSSATCQSQRWLSMESCS